jgi:hypothetical protein
MEAARLQEATSTTLALCTASCGLPMERIANHPTGIQGVFQTCKKGRMEETRKRPARQIATFGKGTRDRGYANHRWKSGQKPDCENHA